QPRFFRPWALGGMPARLLLSADGTSRRCRTSSERTPVTAQNGGFGAYSCAKEVAGPKAAAQTATAAIKSAARVMAYPLSPYPQMAPQDCAVVMAARMPAGSRALAAIVLAPSEGTGIKPSMNSEDAARAVTQATKTLRSVAELREAGLARAGDAAALEQVAARYAVAITADMVRLIDRGDPSDPIA